MLEPAFNSAAHCINPECRRPVIRSLATRVCPTCKTTLRLNNRFIPLVQLSSHRYTATYLAYDLSAKAQVVLKVLIETTPVTVEQFRYTAKVLGNMRCQGLPRVGVKSYFLVPVGGSVQSLPCFAMERIQGKSFQAVIESHPKGCPEGWVIEWLKKMLDAVQFLHGRQLIHGNLTLENVLLQEEVDQPILIGFGNPKPMLARQVMEDWRSQSSSSRSGDTGQKWDPSVDLSALGRICIHLLTGTHPDDLTDSRTGKLHWRQQARVSAPLADLLDRLVQPQASYRLRTAAAVKTVLIEFTEKQERRWKKPHIHRPIHSAKHLKQQARKPASPAIAGEPMTVMQDVRVGSPPNTDLAENFVLLAQMMLNVALMSAIATVMGVWLIFHSPLMTALQALFAGLARSLPATLPFAINPTILLFLIVGLGTRLGLSQGLDRDRSLWGASLVASLGYGISWLGWQWIGNDLPVHSVIRVSAIAAIFLAFKFCSLHTLFIRLLVTALGASTTMLVLMRSHVIQIDTLYSFLSGTLSSVTTSSELSLMMLSIIFFVSLGVSICFWLGFSQTILLSLLLPIFRND